MGGTHKCTKDSDFSKIVEKISIMIMTNILGDPQPVELRIPTQMCT